MPEWESVGLGRRVENPGIWKEEDELRLDTDKVNGIGRKKVKQCCAPGSETTSIPLKNPERVREKGSRRRRRTARSKGR